MYRSFNRNIKAKELLKIPFMNLTRSLISLPLQRLHDKLNPVMTQFGEYNMPITFKNFKTKEIVTNIRKDNSCCVFDVSHMGIIDMYHKNSLTSLNNFLESKFPLNSDVLKENRSVLSVILDKHCSVIDDFIIGNVDNKKYRFVVNSLTKNSFFDYLVDEIEDQNIIIKPRNKIIIAVQGNKSQNILENIIDIDLSNVSFMNNKSVNDIEISRCGYTGEDGFELYLNETDGLNIYSKIIDISHTNNNVYFAGLLERDILRTEAGFLLSGKDFGDNLNINLNDTLLNFTLGKKRRNNMDFKGAANFNNNQYRQSGFEYNKPIKEANIYNENQENIGFVTSSTMSYSKNKFIGIGYLKKNFHGKYIYFTNGDVKHIISEVKLPFLKHNYYKIK
tara:strand:+ start:544 stop:1716 length:1173 start_codon:yes stop_codon:yes gene_type:complete